MLKWTLSKSGMDRTSSDSGSGRYQIKRASVRVLKTENDKENPEHLFGRWLHRDRRAAEPVKKEAVRRGKVRCNPFDPRRIFGKDEPESDSGSVYMRLERLPAAVDGRRRAAPAPDPASGGLRDVTNTQRGDGTRNPGDDAACGVSGRNQMALGRVGRDSTRDANRAPTQNLSRDATRNSNRGLSRDTAARASGRGSSSVGDVIKEFTNKPGAGRDLRRPVALKGDSPEAQQLTEEKRSERQLTAARDDGRDVNPRADASRNEERIYGVIRDSSATRSDQRKPVKKACVSAGRGAPCHAHTTTGQHIHHDYGQRPVSGALQLRLPTPRPTCASGHQPGHGSGHSSGSVPVSQSGRALSVIHEGSERTRRPSGTTEAADPAAIATRHSRAAGFPTSLAARRTASSVSASGAAAGQGRFTPPPPPSSALSLTEAVRYHLTPQLAKLDGQHNTSSERGDSGISEGLVSPLSESQDSHECWEEGSAASEVSRAIHAQGLPSFYFSRPGHLRTDPSLLEAVTAPYPGYPRGDRSRAAPTPRRERHARRPRSHVSVADVLSALQQQQRVVASLPGDTECPQGSLRRSRSFSDVSTLSRDDQTSGGWGEQFAENSANTVIERTQRPPKSVRFALDSDDPIYHEVNGSYAGNDSDALRRSQLYRSYQNIGAVFVGMESSTRPPPPSARPQPEDEETYLVMRSPIKRPSGPARANIAESSRHQPTSGHVRPPSAAAGGSCGAGNGSRGTRCAEKLETSESPAVLEPRGPGGRQRRQRETVTRLSLLLEERPSAMESDESADWSLEAVINDTLQRDLSETETGDADGAERDAPGGDGVSGGDGQFWTVESGEPCSGDSGTEKENTYCSLAPPVSDVSTLDSWSSHARPRMKPPLAAPRALPPPPPPEPTEPVYARLDPAKLSPQVDKVTWHGPGRPTVRSVKSRHKSPAAAGGRIWRHPRTSAASHSTPRKRTARHLRDDSNDFQLGSPGSESFAETLGPGETYSNQLQFARTADSSLATTVWLGLMGRKSRRVVSTQLKTRDLFQPRGHLKLRIYENCGLLTVHVMRARKLRSRSAELCNVYVKVSLVPDSSERSFCRTRLVKQTNAPSFDERFSFDFLPEDHSKRLLVSVWHRHVRRGRSELLGCMSFGVSNIMTTEISGWFRLLAESIGRSRHFAVRTPAAARTKPAAVAADSGDWQERTWEEPRAVESAVTYRRPEARSGQPPEAGCGSAVQPETAREAGEQPWSLSGPSIDQGDQRTTHHQQPAHYGWGGREGGSAGQQRSGRRLAPAPPPSSSAPPGDRVTGGHPSQRSSAPALATHLPRAGDAHRSAPGRSVSCQSVQEARRSVPVCEDQRRTVAAGPYHRITIQRRQKGFGLSLAWTCPP
ncbi:uncharacterized protein LOC122387136, partial [Amphibalanus amphitrite]|uniref:uncharacterized protein LOC122387136 n=1 Tax=Amphibalanus amphitrite TaxID=1232801 RepID=UPI001C8FF03D